MLKYEITNDNEEQSILDGLLGSLGYAQGKDKGKGKLKDGDYIQTSSNNMT